MATHFPLLSYHVDTSNWIFEEAQNVFFPKMYDINCHPAWYRYPNFQGVAHGLMPRRLVAGRDNDVRVVGVLAHRVIRYSGDEVSGGDDIRGWSYS